MTTLYIVTLARATHEYVLVRVPGVLRSTNTPTRAASCERTQTSRVQGYTRTHGTALDRKRLQIEQYQPHLEQSHRHTQRGLGLYLLPALGRQCCQRRIRPPVPFGVHHNTMRIYISCMSASKTGRAPWWQRPCTPGSVLWHGALTTKKEKQWYHKRIFFHVLGK